MKSCQVLTKENRFITFLKKMGVYDQFLTNLRGGFYIDYPDITVGRYYVKLKQIYGDGYEAIENLVSDGFSWEDSYEGVDFWGKIDIEWRRELGVKIGTGFKSLW